MTGNGRGTLGAVLALVLLATTTASGEEPTLEQLKKHQDQLLALGAKDKLLSEYRDRVAQEESAQNRFLLGRVYVKLEQMDKAQPEFERALEIDPLFAPACQGLAICLLARGEIEPAVRELRRALQVNPKDVDSKLLLSEILARSRRRAEAEVMLGEILAENPSHTSARFLLARLLLETRRFEKARDELRVVLQHDPKHLPARKLLAACLSLMGDLRGAETELRQIVSAEPKNYEPRFFLAEIQAKDGRFDDARETLESIRSLEIAPEIEEQVKVALERLDQAEQGFANVRTVGDLVKRLESDDVEVRREAMRRLSKLELPGISRPILQHVTDADVMVRVYVVRMIANTEDPRFIGILAAKLHHPVAADESRLVRGACVEALGVMPGRAAVPVLLVALNDESPYVRELTVQALRSRTGKRFSMSSASVVAEKEVEECRRKWWGWWTSDASLTMKLGAIEDMRKTGRAAMVRYLIPLLEDDSREVFDAAYAAFREVTGRAFGEAGNDKESRLEIAKKARAWWRAGGKAGDE